MRTRRTVLALLALAVLGVSALGLPGDAAAQAPQPKEGWYRTLVDFDAVRAQVDIPPRKGVLVIDSRPAARQYDPGHIPGAISLPDSQFDKLAGQLPADTATQLIFYCGGLECMLSHNSAFKAEKLGYTRIQVYAAGMPDWKARGGPVAVSGAHIRKLIDDKADYLLVDARPRRVADKGMIPTAVNIPDSEFDQHVARLPADKATALIYYCGGLECVLSDKSAEKARKLGHTNVLTYPEGYPEWERLYGGAAAAAVVPGKEKGSITAASFEQVWRENPSSILLVDVRDAKEFATGAIQGAVNLPINELEKKVGTLPADKPVVFICGTGARAGEAYDLVQLLRSELKAFFLDAVAKFGPDGRFTIADRR